ncbi:alpha-tocopherol transfer protein-like [Nephila pilipes]|uniref:Alpha-tocopherol transfer protein-like n=1 Tax=Nephila pilipes TaxID=299642 RepID=A0A8X6MQP3_NEPPI|nr:alpha-tocopherol transfer protein-like [Nephila pilipes]
MLDRCLEDIPQLNQFLPFEMGYLPKEFQDKAAFEINETDENKMRGLTELREMVQRRYKEIHVIKESLLAKTCWTFFKPFLSEKIRNRVYFHSSTEKLLHHFPRAILPTEYGGDIRENDMENWSRKANADHKYHGVTGQPNYF